MVKNWLIVSTDKRKRPLKIYTSAGRLGANRWAMDNSRFKSFFVVPANKQNKRKYRYKEN